MAFTKHSLVYRIVLIPRNEKRVIEGVLVKALYDSFVHCICTYGRWLQDMVINKEQVVLRVQGSPALSAEQLIQLFKSESGARIRVLFPEFKECASEGGFWNDDYIVDSVENKDCDLPQGRVLEYTECDESSEVH